ncbi:MAG: carbohydrate-binding family 9-like protein [Bacteroidales bacterium]|nr:hypothetical protein [Bacteroidales bacterium]MDO4213901.1 carbohydrate-binding family 9-like protein [Bacteroidales bacterium]
MKEMKMMISRTPRRYDLDCLNWPDLFPYKPQVAVEVSHSGSELHLHFMVTEKAVLSACETDRQKIWEDSCVEFFFSPRPDGIYYNLECNCIGKIYFCRGANRSEREFLPPESYELVRRRSSLGSEAFGLREGDCSWELWLDVPACVYGLESFEGLEAQGNFYKCGDRLPERHFVTWAPIDTPRPDYHRPEFFQTIVFE